jgi:hypothetical protein
MMNEARFRAILDAYGGDPRRWPLEERAAASAFAATTEGGIALAEAEALDRMLDLATPSPPSDLLARRILAAAPSRRFAVPCAASGALAAALLLGVLFGFGRVSVVRDGAEADALIAASLDDVLFADDLGAGG